MLQANVVARTDFVTEIKQIAAYQCAHVSIWSEINRANNVCFGIRDIQSFSVSCQSGWLRESRLGRRTVTASFASRAGERRNLLFVEIEFPNLMRPGHRDVKRAAHKLQIPRRVQSNVSGRPRLAAFLRLSPRSGDCLHGLGFQIHLANQMVLGIGDVKRVAVEHHALRTKERGAIEWSI